MEATAVPLLRDQLLERRRQLEAVTVTPVDTDEVARLLEAVDATLGRMDAGTFGLCATCHDPIEPDRLLADPLTQFCLDHLTAGEQRALQQDLDLASRIQRELLPRTEIRFDGWDVAYHYQPAGPVSGDYCDLIPAGADDGYFLIGDVSGKGVAAAILMSHLSATLRTLISLRLPLCELMERASRVFCETTLPNHYATLICGHASSSGEIELCNAGHPPPLLVRADGEIARMEATGVPIGMFCDGAFASRTVHLAPREMLVLYTDGLVEAENAGGDEYGIERLSAVVGSATRQPKAVIEACVHDVRTFRGAPALRDDLTVLVVSRL
jgi:sigma-B regulation protein RsbU (phosphoserine phosphatase)